MRRTVGGLLVFITATAALLASVPAAQATLAIDQTHLALGKVDPGHTSTHTVRVSNSGSEAVNLAAEVLCDCPRYVTVSPPSFPLAKGAWQDITIKVQVAEDADPGIHNTRVRITEVAETGPGGTGQAAYEIDTTFWVRTARLYFDPVQRESLLPIKVVNGYDQNLTVRFEARLSGPGVDRDIPIGPVVAAGSSNARTTHVPVTLPFQETDPAGLFTATVQAEWTDPVTGETYTFGPEDLAVARGAAVILKDFKVAANEDGIVFGGTIENTGGAPVSAWLAVDIVRAAGSPLTVESDPVELAPGTSRPFSAAWMDAVPGEYTAVGYASFASASGQSGRSEVTQPEPFTFTGPKSADEKKGDPAGSLLGSGTLSTVLLAAGAAGVGAAVAVVALRRRK